MVLLTMKIRMGDIYEQTFIQSSDIANWSIQSFFQFRWSFIKRRDSVFDNYNLLSFVGEIFDSIAVGIRGDCNCGLRSAVTFSTRIQRE